MRIQKFILALIAFVTVSVAASAQNVYITKNSGAVAYHSNKNCIYLKKCKDVQPIAIAEAKNIGRHECPTCYKKTTKKAVAKKNVEKKYVAKKPAAKKAAAEKKVTAKKSTTKKKVAAKKKTAPEKK